ncbi:hypothetical protein HUJ04_000671 [Dendroctonus ponderosae]|uniref:Glucose-methanol-choline oxidoreductase N-terminal domain-containing protein n=1 Tax=Dendroctonus ponderosae TaxID=77166 RepID=A0AAR5Q9F1_DENPD|nr:hypothetical protein HUJ04_000671 [Dendroctonus ponderosae]
MPAVGVITYDVTPLQGALANAFLILINALFFHVKFIGHVNQYPEDSSEKLLREDENVFDFIIVGAGAAGCALANRLSEQDQWSVLLIEAGDYPQPSTGVPGLFPTFLDSSTDTWQYTIAKNKQYCQAYKNKQCHILRGKLVGGTSAINNMHYIRGLDDGNKTQMIYECIENHVELDKFNNLDLMCKREIYLEQVFQKSIVRKSMQDAYHSIGFSNNSQKSSIGYGNSYLTIRDGERYHMGRAFLTPLKGRSNFFLAKNTLVEGIVLNDPLDKRAKGVNVTIKNIRLFLQARKELILTAGPINNAKLLLLSGIGPKEYLLKRDIPVMLNMPGVGENLNFHLAVPLFFGLNATQLYEDYTETDLVQDTFDYVVYRSGNFSNVGIHDFVTFMSTDAYPNVPNIAVYHYYFKVGDRMIKTWLEGLQLNQKIVTNILKANEQQTILMFLVTLLRTKSVGQIQLNDTHFHGIPNIVGNFFTDPDGEDFIALTSAISRVANLQDTPPFETIGAQLLDIRVPNCRNYKFCSVHYVKCYVQNMAFPTSDISGSLRRGPECDTSAVVKPDYEVRYIRCLRVCDSSILPNPGLGNTVASDAMMAIDLSEILKKKWIKDYMSPFD